MFKSLSSILNNNALKKKFTTKKSKNFVPQRFKKTKKYSKECFDFLNLIKFWPEIVGERLSQHTIPLKNKNQNLIILTDHSAFSQQLSFMEEILKKKIFQKFPSLRTSIKRLSFQVNTTIFNQKKQITKPCSKKDNSRLFYTTHKYSPKYRSLKEIASNEFKHIDDQEIRDTLTSLYIQNHIDKI